MSAASEKGSSGLSAIDAHTMMNHRTTNSSSSRERSHSDIRLRVSPLGLRSGSTGGGGGAAGPEVSATGTVMASPGR